MRLPGVGGQRHTRDVAYDQALADRLRDVLAAEPGVREKPMFGGLGFLLGGHLAVAASSSGDLMVRVDPAEGGDLVDGAAVRPTEMRGRSMTGWLLVDLTAVEDDAALRAWVDRGVAYARSLPEKESP